MLQRLTILLTGIILLCIPVSAWAEYEIGMVGAVEERAWAEQGNRVRHLEAGSPIYLDEQIVTGRQGRVQILFSDNSTLALGPSSRIHLKYFLYPHHDGELPGLHFVMRQGTFRFAPGEMALYFRDGIRLDSPMASTALPGGMSGHRIQPGWEQHFHLYQETSYVMVVNSLATSRQAFLNGVRNMVEISSRADLGAARPMSISEMSLHNEVNVGQSGRPFDYLKKPLGFQSAPTKREWAGDMITTMKTDARWLELAP